MEFPYLRFVGTANFPLGPYLPFNSPFNPFPGRRIDAPSDDFRVMMVNSPPYFQPGVKVTPPLPALSDSGPTLGNTLSIPLGAALVVPYCFCQTLKYSQARLVQKNRPSLRGASRLLCLSLWYDTPVEWCLYCTLLLMTGTDLFSCKPKLRYGSSLPLCVVLFILILILIRYPSPVPPLAVVSPPRSTGYRPLVVPRIVDVAAKVRPAFFSDPHAMVILCSLISPTQFALRSCGYRCPLLIAPILFFNPCSSLERMHWHHVPSPFLESVGSFSENLPFSTLKVIRSFSPSFFPFQLAPAPYIRHLRSSEQNPLPLTEMPPLRLAPFSFPGSRFGSPAEN